MDSWFFGRKTASTGKSSWIEMTSRCRIFSVTQYFMVYFVKIVPRIMYAIVLWTVRSDVIRTALLIHSKYRTGKLTLQYSKSDINIVFYCYIHLLTHSLNVITKWLRLLHWWQYPQKVCFNHREAPTRSWRIIMPMSPQVWIRNPHRNENYFQHFTCKLT